MRLMLQAGSYQPADIIDLIKKQEVELSFPSAALKNQSLNLEEGSYRVDELMPLIFDDSRYRWLLRKGKLLVVPKSNTRVKTYSGFVEEAGSHERLVGVNVAVPSLNIGTTTNSYGYYSLSVPVTDTLEAVVSFIGYESQVFYMYQGNSDINDFQLRPKSTELTEVTVTDKMLSSELVQASETALGPEVFEKMPSLLGEIDVIKVLQMLPGVQSGSEASSGLYVRGGSPDQNLLLLDGVPVYNASHLFGFFSVFNADAIKNVTLTKGGFPARYGGRLSSVVSIDMKEGNMNEYHGRGSLGLLASRLTVEGPIVKNKTSFALSGRRTYFDLLMRPFWDDDNSIGYFFHDVNAKLNHIFSRNDRLYLSFYTGKDKFYYNLSDLNFKSENSVQWGNYTGSMRWNHIYNNKLFGNLTALYTQYEFRTSIYYENKLRANGFDYFSRIRDYGLHYDFEYQPVLNHKFRYGISYTFHDFKPRSAEILGGFGAELSDTSFDISQRNFSNDLYVYAEDQWDISENWKANYGLHYATYFVKDAFYHSLQPRAGLRYLLHDDWSLKASYARMMQSVHLLTNNSVGLPTDIWVTSNERVKPQYSQQLALGSTKNFGEDWELTSEVYYKWMHNLIAYKEGSGLLNSTNWANAVETDGTGKSYGAEVFLRRSAGKTTGWIGYTLSWTQRQFSNINGGETFPFKYDRRHDVSVVFNHAFSERFDFSFNWVYGTGVAFTMPLSDYLVFDEFGNVEEVTQYSARNAYRMPAYHRLDVGFNFHKTTDWGKGTFNISLYNAYSRRNPYAIEIQRQPDSPKRKIMQVSLFPVIPSISYTFEF